MYNSRATFTDLPTADTLGSTQEFTNFLGICEPPHQACFGPLPIWIKNIILFFNLSCSHRIVKRGRCQFWPQKDKLVEQVSSFTFVQSLFNLRGFVERKSQTQRPFWKRKNKVIRTVWHILCHIRIYCGAYQAPLFWQPILKLCTWNLPLMPT